MNEYTAYRYKGKEWGVFASRCRCWVVFGKKKAMIEKAKRLNEMEREGKNENRVHAIF